MTTPPRDLKSVYEANKRAEPFTPEREIDIWPGDEYRTDREQLVWRAAQLSHDETCELPPERRITWLTAGAEKIAAIVPVEAAERWLENPQELTEAQLAYGRIYRGESTPTEEQAKVMERVLSGQERSVTVSYKPGMARPEFRTKSGRLLSDAELDALSAEAGQGYDISQARPTVNHPAVITKLAAVIDSLIAVGVLQPYMIGLPWHPEDEDRLDGDRQAAIETWLRS